MYSCYKENFIFSDDRRNQSMKRKFLFFIFISFIPVLFFSCGTDSVYRYSDSIKMKDSLDSAHTAFQKKIVDSLNSNAYKNALNARLQDSVNKANDTLHQLEMELQAESEADYICLKENDSIYFSSYRCNPKKGLRFSVGNVASKKDVVLDTAQLRNLGKDKTIFTWGKYADNGAPVRMDYAHFHKKFIIDKDYWHAPEINFEFGENIKAGGGFYSGKNQAALIFLFPANGNSSSSSLTFVYDIMG